jgi:hypothetical protein
MARSRDKTKHFHVLRCKSAVLQKIVVIQGLMEDRNIHRVPSHHHSPEHQLQHGAVDTLHLEGEVKNATKLTNCPFAR